ncbi:hypothetical protein CCM_09190 [Cordyceps militaris CM01]|uniref:Uncharacterized protein n=1 Tax=Cordyceps militaris (strain CM01) TaxID=983644 RepID=G3JTQ0_CORMM|nr:uncharacterized protein CCM_09190 [Cordyceps militaris CM01]EGX88054.1 hypothetical protein CCM_09190 [Cordyceps militaris CM01]
MKDKKGVDSTGRPDANRRVLFDPSITQQQRRRQQQPLTDPTNSFGQTAGSVAGPAVPNSLIGRSFDINQLEDESRWLEAAIRQEDILLARQGDPVGMALRLENTQRWIRRLEALMETPTRSRTQTQAQTMLPTPADTPAATPAAEGAGGTGDNGAAEKK